MQERKKNCENSLQMLQESLSAETKSSAGDKHETGRAMIQLEREQMGAQLFKIEQEERMLMKINPERVARVVGLGSLVKTNTLLYFICISLGKINVENEEIWVISPESPMGKILLGKGKQDSLSFNHREITIQEIG